jgi:hypothetical protein
MIATSKDVREWARRMGMPVGERGTLQANVWHAYLEQHPEASN